MKIAILDDYQDCVRKLPCFSLLAGFDVKIFNSSAKGLGQLAIRLAPFDVLVLIRERTHLSRALLARLPNLKLICQTGPLGEHVDVPAAQERGIVVMEGADDAIAAAELSFALILAANRKLVRYAGLLQQGVWQAASVKPASNTLGRRQHGRILGIWGYGRVGRQVARYARAFHMDVHVWGSAESRAQALSDGLIAAESRHAFFAAADVLSLHLRLSGSTRHIVGLDDLLGMKTDALFVNTSRAGLIAPGALEKALQAGRPGQAALDVFDAEPLPVTSALLQMENVLATPHIGFVEQDSYAHDFGLAFESIVRLAHQRALSSP